MTCRMVIGLHGRPGLLVMCMRAGDVHVVGHRFAVVVDLCRGRRRRTEGHRRGSEALKRHRQQRHPDDQDFQDGFHAAILAYAKVSEIPWAAQVFTKLRHCIVQTYHFCIC